jgi:hypothetical protein
MPTDAGKATQTTVKYGCRMNRRAGLLTAMAAGCMNHITAGLGLATSRGVGLPITMDVGCGMAAHGRGGRDRFGVWASTVHSGRRLMYRSLDSEAGLDLVSDLDGADLAGCRLGPVTASFRGGADMADDSA